MSHPRLSLALEYAHMPARMRRRILGNPAPIHRTESERVVRYCRASLHYAGRMVYDEGRRRSQLFHRRPGDFAGAHADCSQYGAAILHWVGVHDVTDTDWTGTLWHKGRALDRPEPGCGVIFGAEPGVHFGFYVGDGNVIGFGEQTAPDEVALSTLQSYFRAEGHPGVRYLSFG